MGCDQLRVVEDFSFDMKNNNILSRNSSLGCSSRIYYYRSTGTQGIPFQWEMQPGTPKNPPPKEEALPPLSPPPAVLSLGLPKPCISDMEPFKPRRRLIIRFWKKIRKNDHLLKITNKKSDQNINVLNDASDYKDETFEFCSSDCEFMSSSPARNSSSSSSSSLSFSNGLSRQSSRLHSPAWHPPSRSTLNCSPWNISNVLVSLAKRV